MNIRNLITISILFTICTAVCIGSSIEISETIERMTPEERERLDAITLLPQYILPLIPIFTLVAIILEWLNVREWRFGKHGEKSKTTKRTKKL